HTDECRKTSPEQLRQNPRLLSSYPLYILEGHTDRVYGLAFSPDGTRLASIGTDGTVRLWDPTTGQPVHILQGQTGHQSPVALAFSPDGKRLAFGGGLSVWDTTTGQELFRERTYGARYVAFSPDGTRLISSGAGRSVKVWDATTDTLAATLAGPSEIHSVAFSPDGQQFATASEDQLVRLWDPRTGQIEATWKVGETLPGQEALIAFDVPSRKYHPQKTAQVTFSPDGQHVAATSGKIVKIWNRTTRQEVRTLTGHTHLVLSVAFHPDGTRLASSGRDRTIRVWDVATGQKLLTLEGHEGHYGVIGFSPLEAIGSVVFSPDGTRLASGGRDGTVRVWDATSGAPLRTLEHIHRVHCMAFHPDGTRLAAGGGGGTVRVWDLTSGLELFTLPNPGGAETFGVAFSTDGNRLVSTNYARHVMLWDAATGQELLRLEGHTGPTHAVAFSPDGTRLASASWDGTVRLWDARPATPAGRGEREALSLVAALVAKPLCRADIRDYLHRAPAVSAEARQLALSLVDRYREETDPARYHQAAWELVRQPYLNAVQYGFALRQAETACRRAPEQGKYWTTLGVAQYRVGQYLEARATLTRADAINGGIPADLAFLAMTHHQLGQRELAQAALTRLRSLFQDPVWKSDRRAHAFLEEAEELEKRLHVDSKK
ncbi:MAG: hypothetical protein L0Z62_49865, partial [Gemmataceae bacterium]|nr:hypothetical protein [Gemmataceae bacterium]